MLLDLNQNPEKTDATYSNHRALITESTDLHIIDKRNYILNFKTGF